MLIPELGAGIRRVKGVWRLGVSVGNWLTPAQGKFLLERSTARARATVTVNEVLDDYLSYLTLKGRKSVQVITMVFKASIRPACCSTTSGGLPSGTGAKPVSTSPSG